MMQRRRDVQKMIEKILTVEIRGCNSPEKFDQVKEVLLDGRTHQNAPHLYADFTSREKAHFAVVNLNIIPGIKAVIIGE